VVLPTSPESQGTICRGFRPDWQVGVWVMPDNSSDGMLEDFLAATVPEGQRALWSHAAQATTAARQFGATFAEMHRRKAELHAWLAWQDPPGVALGHAVREQMFTVECVAAQEFVGWLSRLLS
jgi:hypothetical protein